MCITTPSNNNVTRQNYSLTRISLRKIFFLNFITVVGLGLISPMAKSALAEVSPNVLPSPPSKVELVSPQQTSLTLSWQPGNSPVNSYWVNYQTNPKMSKDQTRGLDCQFGQQPTKLQSATTQYTFKNLQPGAYYDFAICSYSKKVVSLRSDVIRVSGKTLEASPPSPTNFVANSLGSTRLSLTWKASAGTTFGYLLAMQQGNNPQLSCQGGTDLGSTLGTHISGLTASTTYTFALCSYNHDKILSSPVVISPTTTSGTGTGQVLNCNAVDESLSVAIYHEPVNATSAPTVCPSGSACYTQNYQLYGAITQSGNTVATYPVVSSAVIATLGGGTTFSGGLMTSFVSAKGGSDGALQSLMAAMQSSSVTASGNGFVNSSNVVPVSVVDSATNGQQFNLQPSSSSALSYFLNAVLENGSSINKLNLNCPPPTN